MVCCKFHLLIVFDFHCSHLEGTRHLEVWWMDHIARTCSLPLCRFVSHCSLLHQRSQCNFFGSNLVLRLLGSRSIYHQLLRLGKLSSYQVHILSFCLGLWWSLGMGSTLGHRMICDDALRTRLARSLKGWELVAPHIPYQFHHGLVRVGTWHNIPNREDTRFSCRHLVRTRCCLVAWCRLGMLCMIRPSWWSTKMSHIRLLLTRQRLVNQILQQYQLGLVCTFVSRNLGSDLVGSRGRFHLFGWFDFLSNSQLSNTSCSLGLVRSLGSLGTRSVLGDPSTRFVYLCTLGFSYQWHNDVYGWDLA